MLNAKRGSESGTGTNQLVGVDFERGRVENGYKYTIDMAPAVGGDLWLGLGDLMKVRDKMMVGATAVGSDSFLPVKNEK